MKLTVNIGRYVFRCADSENEVYFFLSFFRGCYIAVIRIIELLYFSNSDNLYLIYKHEQEYKSEQQAERRPQIYQKHVDDYNVFVNGGIVTN